MARASALGLLLASAVCCVMAAAAVHGKGCVDDGMAWGFGFLVPSTSSALSPVTCETMHPCGDSACEAECRRRGLVQFLHFCRRWINPHECCCEH